MEQLQCCLQHKKCPAITSFNALKTLPNDFKTTVSKA